MPTAYQRLPNEDGDEKYVEARRSRFSVAFAVLLLIVCIETTALVAMAVHRKPPLPQPPVLYSPAQHVVEEIIKVYPVGFNHDKSPFQVPSSPELDDAWEDLYQFGISRIPKGEAALLPNKTSPIPGDPGYYIIELDVFHQLHCLNTIRKALDPTYYPKWNISKPGFAQDHISHCVDWIRHSIMCHSDTSVVVWQWDPRHNETFTRPGVPHTCRNFGLIQQWGRENTLAGEFDYYTHVPDDLPTPPDVY